MDYVPTHFHYLLLSISQSEAYNRFQGEKTIKKVQNHQTLALYSEHNHHHESFQKTDSHIISPSDTQIVSVVHLLNDKLTLFL